MKYDEVEIYSMLDIYNKCVDKGEKCRIEKIEFLDELEEWNIMMDHYYVFLGKNISKIEFKSFLDIKLYNN